MGKNIKNEFAGVMSASLLLASASTLLINSTEQSCLNNGNNLNTSYASEASDFMKNNKVKTVSYESNNLDNISKSKKSSEKKNKKKKKEKDKNNNSNKKYEIKKKSSDSSSKSNSKSYKIFDDFSKEDRFILYRIVEAEAGDGNIQAKKNVAHVIFNRLNSKKFPNDIRDIVFAKHQFSPISDGRYFKVNIAESTKEAVIKAYEEGDTTGGALYFANMKYVPNRNTRRWFNSMNCLFTDSINHSFYK